MSFKNPYIQVSLAILVLVLAYSPTLLSHQVINPDGTIILPRLDQYTSLVSYLKDLYRGQTYDLQPIRDLSLLLDITIWNKFNINTFIFQNILIWSLCCFVIFKIQKTLFPHLSQKTHYFLILMFTCYPLSSASVNWGIARKHLLSFLFITLTLKLFLETLDDKTWSKKKSLMTFTFFLSVLSQPISVLWPFWALLYVFLNQRQHFKKTLLHLSPTFLLMAITIGANAWYYKSSVLFNLTFESKTEHLSVGDVVLATGHYMFQIFAPYTLAVSYHLAHWTIPIGVFILVALVLLTYKSLHRNNLISWLAFIFFPLVVVLRSPQMLSDTYLLISCLGAYFFLLEWLSKKHQFETAIKYLVTPTLVLWIVIINVDARSWRGPVPYLKEKNFDKTPSCNSAIRLTVSSFIHESKANEEAKNYILSNDCSVLGDKTMPKLYLTLQLKSIFIYEDKTLSLDEKISELAKIGKIYYFPELIVIALYLDHSLYANADEAIHAFYLKNGTARWPRTYIDIAAKKIRPYCLKGKNEECLKALDGFTHPPTTPYL